MQQVIRVNYAQKKTVNNKDRVKQTDIRVLGEALIGIANTIDRANAIATRSNASMSFHIGKHEIGSDIIDITVTTAVCYAPLLLQSVDLLGTLKDIGFFEGSPMSLLKFLKWKDENPVHEVIEESEKGITVKTGNNSPVFINSTILNLSRDEELITNLGQALKYPLESGVESICLESRNGEEELKGIPFSKDNLPSITTFDEVPEDPEVIEMKKWLTITRPDLDKGTDFYFKDDHGSKDKKIIIEDEKFITSVLNGKKFKHGDCIYVLLEELQSFNKKGQLKTKMTIKNVFNFKSSEIVELS